MPRDFPPKSEGAVLRTLMLYASEHGAVLFRNTRGIYKVAQQDCKSCQRFGFTVSTGLTNGAPDLVGWTPVLITPEHVGKQVAIFTGIEAKREVGGVVSEEQRRFLTALELAGAIQGVARSVGDLDDVLGPWKSK